jgi:hypothetical protein
VTISEALAAAFERSEGTCECIGGGCPALSHRPDVNRCFGSLRSIEHTFFFTAARFADRTDPANLVAMCAACGATPRKNAERVLDPSVTPVLAGEE